MRRLKKSSLVFCICVLVLAYAAKSCVFPTRHAVQIYYPEKNNLFLVPVTRWVPRVTAEALLAELKKPPRINGLLPALPEGFPLESVGVHQNILLVEFNKNPEIDKDPLVLKAVLATFKQLPGMETVKFLVNGKTGFISNGVELGDESLASFWVNNNLCVAGSGYKSAQEGQSATLYYLLKGTEIFVPVAECVSAKLPLEEAIVETLQAPPPFSWALASPLPAGSTILSARRVSTGRIDMTLRLAGSNAEKQLARKALLLTFTELPSVRRVTLREKGNFWEGFLACQRPRIINAEPAKP